MSHYTGSVPDAQRAVDWRQHAACGAMDLTGKPLYHPELFFPPGNAGPSLLQIEEAKTVCNGCSVVDACLDWALRNTDHGVAGGLSEDERRALKRRTARHRPEVQQPVRPATPEGLWEQHARPLGQGHFRWQGPSPARTAERTFTPMQLAFIVTRGREPVGKLTRACTVPNCVRHVLDAEERTRCGTRGGYRKHLAEGTEICVPCRRGNAAADSRLRTTGTTKAVV